MNMLKKRRLRILFTAFIGAVGIGAYIGLWHYHAAVTEAAFSLCAGVLKRNETSVEKSEKVKDFLVFTRMSEARKQKLLAAILREDDALLEIAEKMEYFSYSNSTLLEIFHDIDDLENDSVAVFRISKAETAEDNAKELIRKLFGRRVTFQSEDGDGTNILKRYYCANICVDACADGSVRYLSDIRAAGGEDPLIALLFSTVDTEVLRSEEICGVIYQSMRSKEARADLCIHLQTGRVFAAKILFNS